MGVTVRLYGILVGLVSVRHAALFFPLPRTPHRVLQRPGFQQLADPWVVYHLVDRFLKFAQAEKNFHLVPTGVTQKVGC